MDVELQILKHLRRDAQPTVGVIDEYCEEYTETYSKKSEIMSASNIDIWK